MTLFMRLTKSLLIFMVVLGLISFILPQKQHVERSLEIVASGEKIYPYLANPKLFNEWSPWSKIDPKIKVQYMGPELGKGAGMKWQSDDRSVGHGSWIISDAVENKSVNINMDFGDQGQATSFFTLQENEGKARVTWGFDTDAGNNPIMRWMGLLMDKMVGSEYEKGLEALKQLVEK